jgi:hypothetical protein
VLRVCEDTATASAVRPLDRSDASADRPLPVGALPAIHHRPHHWYHHRYVDAAIRPLPSGKEAVVFLFKTKKTQAIFGRKGLGLKKRDLLD